MVVGVGFCKIKVDSNFLLVLKIKCTKFHQDRSKTVDLHTKYTNKQTFSFIYIYIDIISLIVEVSLFVASPEIEGRTAVEADNWATFSFNIKPLLLSHIPVLKSSPAKCGLVILNNSLPTLRFPPFT
jgi:hypothetical protein